MKVPHCCSLTSHPYPTLTHQPEETTQSSRESLKRPQLSASAPSPIKKRQIEMQSIFVHGIDDHIDTYANCIDEAESHIIIASWNLNFIKTSGNTSSLVLEDESSHLYTNFLTLSSCLSII